MRAQHTASVGAVRSRELREHHSKSSPSQEEYEVDAEANLIPHQKLDQTRRRSVEHVHRGHSVSGRYLRQEEEEEYDNEDDGGGWTGTGGGGCGGGNGNDERVSHTVRRRRGGGG